MTTDKAPTRMAYSITGQKDQHLVVAMTVFIHPVEVCEALRDAGYNVEMTARLVPGEPT